jgi:hypothetical protein
MPRCAHVLPPVTLAGFGLISLIPDPRLSRVPADGAEFREIVATSWGRRPPLATALRWLGRPVRSARRSQGSLLLDPWGFALTAAFEPAGLSAGSWRVHHDALTHLFYGDAMRAGVEGRVEPHGLSPTCFPPPLATSAGPAGRALCLTPFSTDNAWAPTMSCALTSSPP